ncbi:MAG: zinc-binding dehydrogenase, partial [Promethearchaeota archaeon]
EVLIEIKFAALNHLDLFILRGWPGLNLEMPHIIGADGAGIVKEIGSEVTTVSEGDRITINPGISCGKCEMCLSGKQVFCKQFSILGEHQWGTYAQMLRIPEFNVLKIPDNYPFDRAAAAPLTSLTAWRMITTQAKLKLNDYVFIHGAGGGVATAAIQIAKLLGAKVIATTSTSEKVEKAKELGADFVINYKEMKDYTKYVYTELTKRHGIDVVIDSVGKATFTTSINLLRPGGRLITCGVTSGPFTKIDITNIFWKHLKIKGSTMANQGEFRQVMELVFNGDLNPIIDKVFPLTQVKEAERYLSEGNQFGKVLLKIS